MIHCVRKLTLCKVKINKKCRDSVETDPDGARFTIDNAKKMIIRNAIIKAYKNQPEWRNWQTRRIQNPVLATG